MSASEIDMRNELFDAYEESEALRYRIHTLTAELATLRAVVPEQGTSLALRYETHTRTLVEGDVEYLETVRRFGGEPWTVAAMSHGRDIDGYRRTETVPAQATLVDALAVARKLTDGLRRQAVISVSFATEDEVHQ